MVDHPPVAKLAKTPTGIEGFDEITEGGLPTGRPSLLCGGAGCGKTLFAISFLVHGATRFDEPGVFMSFEESTEELAQNVASLGFDLSGLIQKKKIALDHVRIDRSEIEETGDYDLEGLFIRLGYSIDSIGARRVVLDTIESLFSAMPFRPNESRPASRGSIRCSAAKATSGGARFSCPVPPAPARAVWPPTSWTPPAVAASARSRSCSRNRPRRSCGT